MEYKKRKTDYSKDINKKRNITSIRYSTDGTHIIIGEGAAGDSSSGNIRKLDANTLDPKGIDLALPSGVIDFHLRDDNLTIATCSNGKIYFLNQKTGVIEKSISTQFGSTLKSAISPDRQTIAIGGQYGFIHLINTFTGDTIHVLENTSFNEERRITAGALSFNSSGSQLAVVGSGIFYGT